MQCLHQFSKNLRSAISGTILNFSEIKWLRFNVVFVKWPKSPFLTHLKKNKCGKISFKYFVAQHMFKAKIYRMWSQ